MKIEIKYKKKVEEETIWSWYLFLSMIVIFGYGAWIGYLLDSNFLLLALPFGGFMGILVLLSYLPNIIIRRIKR